jgi:uncharacterized membrane protein YpjA
MLKRIGYGLITWVIPYVTAIPLMPLMRSDPAMFKSIMIVEGSIVGAALTAYYFLKVKGGFLREGIVLAAVWVATNWVLDVIALLPFSGHSLPRYFVEIGIEYLAIFSTPVAIGYVLHVKAGSAAEVTAPASTRKVA